MDLRVNADEASRVEVLRGYRILDTARSRAFDRLVGQAAREFGCPIAFLGLIDTDRIWFKATVGLGERREMPRSGAVTMDRLLREDPYAVSDMTADADLAQHPLVREEGARFFAAAPLVTPQGHCLGALVTIDTEPRYPSEEQLARLRDLATAAMHQMEQRRSVLGTLRSGTPVRPHHADSLDVASVLGRRRPLQVRVTDDQAEDTWVAVAGSVDSDVSERLERELLRLVPDPTTGPEGTGDRGAVPRMLLDLSGLQHFGAAAFTVLLAVADRVQQTGGELVVGRSSPAVRRALHGMDPRGRLRVIG